MWMFGLILFSSFCSGNENWVDFLPKVIWIISIGIKSRRKFWVKRKKKLIFWYCYLRFGSVPNELNHLKRLIFIGYPDIVTETTPRETMKQSERVHTVWKEEAKRIPLPLLCLNRKLRHTVRKKREEKICSCSCFCLLKNTEKGCKQS